MEWIERLNAAMNYIEENLTQTIDYEQLGRLACCSAYHFQRMFGYMADMPLSEYIRRRRMSRAAVDLQSGEEKIIDVALKYGYDSPTAFNRAFQTVHGFAPSATRLPGTVLKSFPPICFHISIKGAVQMDYRIEKKEAFRIVGRSMPLEHDMEKNFATVPGFWNSTSSDGTTIPQLCQLMDTPIKGILGVCACGGDDWRYYIAVASTQPVGELDELEIGSFTWAIFTGTGTGLSIQELEKHILQDWLPTSGYEYADGPDVEVYLNPDPTNMQYEVWIPVVKKA